MATVNFSVPDEVKIEFDKAFGNQNKSSIIAELITGALGESSLSVSPEGHRPIPLVTTIGRSEPANASP